MPSLSDWATSLVDRLRGHGVNVSFDVLSELGAMSSKAANSEEKQDERAFKMRRCHAKTSPAKQGESQQRVGPALAARTRGQEQLVQHLGGREQQQRVSSPLAARTRGHKQLAQHLGGRKQKPKRDKTEQTLKRQHLVMIGRGAPKIIDELRQALANLKASGEERAKRSRAEVDKMRVRWQGALTMAEEQANADKQVRDKMWDLVKSIAGMDSREDKQQAIQDFLNNEP